MRMFPYEVGDPIDRNGNGAIIENLDDVIHIAVHRNGKIIWRGSLADLAETLDRPSDYVVYTTTFDDRTSHLPTIAMSDLIEPPRDLGGFNCAGEYRWPENQRTRNPDDFKIAKTRREVWKNGQWWIDENDCPGHVASKNDPKICGRCGVHIDSLRPSED